MKGPSRQFYGFEAEPLSLTQTLIEGEALLSWIARSTIEYELPNITTITRDVGQRHRNCFVDVMRKDIDVNALATILGGRPEDVLALRGHHVGDAKIRYLDTVIWTDDLHTKSRRFAPATLADDEVPFYRASWLLRTFPVCTATWQILRTRCDCGARVTWGTVSTMVLCEACDGDLRELASEEVPGFARPGLQFLADVLFGDDNRRSEAMSCLPASLRALDPGEVLEVALLMTRVIDPSMPNPRYIWDRDPGRLAAALSKAGELLPEWPHALWLGLELAGDVKTMKPRCQALKRLFRVLDGSLATRVPTSVIEDIGRMRREITLDGDEPVTHLVELNEAETILHKTKRDIRMARTNGHLKPHFAIRRGEIIPAYDRAELEAFAATTRWPSTGRVVRRLGIPPYGVEQLAAMDDLIWAKAPHRTLKRGLRIEPSSVDMLIDRLRQSASAPDAVPDPVSINWVMRGVGGREKPWGPLLRGLMEERWPFTVIESGAAVREIRVSLADAEAMRALVFDHDQWRLFHFTDVITLGDACDILNVSVRTRSVLRGFKKGTWRKTWVFDRSSVRDLAAKTVNRLELRARYPADPRAAAAAIRRAKLVPHAFGYLRDDALQAFEAALAH